MASKVYFKENRFGAPYLIYTYTLIVVLIPIVTDMSIVTITNIFQVITFFMNVTVVYAISRLPKDIRKHGQRINSIFQMGHYIHSVL